MAGQLGNVDCVGCAEGSAGVLRAGSGRVEGVVRAWKQEKILKLTMIYFCVLHNSCKLVKPLLVMEGKEKGIGSVREW